MKSISTTLEDMIKIAAAYEQANKSLTGATEAMRLIAKEKVDWSKLSDKAEKRLEKWEKLRSDLELATESPPEWPSPKYEPSTSDLLKLPGFDSDSARKLKPIPYYNSLMKQLWTQGSSDHESLNKLHNGLTARVVKLIKEEVESVKKMNATELPKSCVAPVVYSEGDHPFKTEDDLEKYLLALVAWDMRVRKLKYGIAGPSSVAHLDHNFKFIGMEQYQYEWMEWEFGKDQKVFGTYYFSSKNAGIPNLYGIDDIAAKRLFGDQLFKDINQTTTDVMRRTEVVDLRAAFQRQLLAERYKDSPIAFGSW